MPYCFNNTNLLTSSVLFLLFKYPFHALSFLEPVQNLARSRQKTLIFENRSAAYVWLCEQRIAENRLFMADIVEILNRFLVTHSLYGGFAHGI